MKKTLIIGEELGSSAAKFSTKIADEAINRGWEVWQADAKDIFFENGKVFANATSYGNSQIRNQKSEIKNHFNIVHFRPNPPVDMAYMTLLYMLRMIEDQVRIVNKPSSIINFPEKIFPHILGDCSPPSLISQNIEEIKNFAQKHGEIVAKPLYGFGGFDIKKLTASEVDAELAAGVNIYQKFMPEVTNGTIRLSVVGGKIHSHLIQIPKQGSIESNLAMGGESKEYSPSEKQNKQFNELADRMYDNEIFYAGIDLIEGKIIEINITSPGPHHNEIDYGLSTEKQYWDHLENA